MENNSGVEFSLLFSIYTILVPIFGVFGANYSDIRDKGRPTTLLSADPICRLNKT